MIRQIIYKEITQHVLSLRFVVSLILISLLFAASGFMFVGNFRQQSEDYWREINNNLSALDEQAQRLYQLAFYEQTIWRKPKPLSLCAGGFERSLPDWFCFNIFNMALPEVKSRSNFLLPYFIDIDWVFVISLILSFVILLFVYDSVCGEKESGTLGLILANSVPRHNVLLGKYLGVMFTLGIPMLVGLLVNLTIVLSSGLFNLDTEDWLRILGLVLVSFLYLSIFAFLGIFISSRSTHSAVSMVVLLFIWVGLVILIPGLGRAASRFSSQKSAGASLQSKLAQVDEEMWTDISGKFGKNAGRSRSNFNDPLNNPPARARWKNAWANAKNQVIEDHHNQMLAQAVIGRRFACISPTVVYQRASEAISGTGISRIVDLRNQIKRYQDDLKEYILSEDQQDPNSHHLLIASKFDVENWGTISKKPVDFDTVPKFQERDVAVGDSLQRAIWDIGLLILFNIVFFAASFVSFLRYDVR